MPPSTHDPIPRLGVCSRLRHKIHDGVPGRRRSEVELHEGLAQTHVVTVRINEAGEDQVAWFEFDALCDAPRAAPDYIELARDYHTIILSGVPVMDEDLDDKARRFVYLIDELYDRRVKLIISADAEPEKLYTGSMLKFAFKRTCSRLVEMRSKDYLESPHKAPA